jgi:iron-sulfur cluster repair protein YtfE (RIC family)
VKRHPALIRLSREHHGALILARLIQKDAPPYKGLPLEINGKVVYAQEFYKNILIAHFIAEEKILPLVKGLNSEIDVLIIEILEQHDRFHVSFNSINNQDNLAVHLDQLGKDLELHIRKEERQLFCLIQENCSEHVLNTIGMILST